MTFALSTQNNMFAPSNNPAVIAAAEAAKTRIQSAYIMAFQKPRDEESSRQAILEACKRPAFADKAIYQKPVGNKKKVEGLSIRFAETAIRAWKNIDIDETTIYEDENTRRIKVTCIDLESNTTFSKEIDIQKLVERKNKSDREVVGERLNSKGDKVFIVKATEDELYNKAQSLVSKAIRNSGLRLIPEDILEEALTACKKTQLGKIQKNLKEETKKIIDAFAGINVSVEQIQEFLNHKVSDSSPSEIQELRNMFSAIKDGEATIFNYLEEVREQRNEQGKMDDDVIIDGKSKNKKNASGKKKNEDKKEDLHPLCKEIDLLIKKKKISELEVEDLVLALTEGKHNQYQNISDEKILKEILCEIDGLI